MESTTQIFLRVQVGEDEHTAVEGESLAGGYAKRMQIDSFSFGMDAKLQAPPRPGAKGANLDLNEVRVTKYFDRASISLAGLLKKREPLHEVRITVDQQLEEIGVGKAQNAIIVFHLQNARIVDFKLDVSEDKVSATVKETVSFTFKNFAVEYYYKGTTNNKKSDYRDKYVAFETEYNPQD